MSNSKWNKNVPTHLVMETGLTSNRDRGASLPGTAQRQNHEADVAIAMSGRARNAVVAAGLSRREE